MFKKFFYIILFLFIFSTVFADGIIVKTDKDNYYRYECVKITCKFISSKKEEKTNILNTLLKQATPDYNNIKKQALCYARVYLNKKLIKTVGNTEELPLKYNQTNDTWEASWPIPWNPTIGTYNLIIILKIDGKSYSGKINFNIIKRTPPQMDKNFCVMNIEPGDSIIQRVPGVGGKTVKIWENYVLWAKFMGASALWHCVGQSQIWNSFNPEIFPWDKTSVRQVREIAQACHDYGLKYGAYILSFIVLGNRKDLSPYEQTIGYDKQNNTLRKLIYVSIADQKRWNDIIELFKYFNSIPEIDFIGMDYVRTDFGGYEMVNEFVSDMPVKNLPDDWSDITDEDRMLWFGKTLEIDKDPDIEQMWQWWRAHKMSKIIKEIKEKSGLKKPLWTFTLTWRQGKEHGQDPLMFIDAGVDINGLMFYSIDKKTYPQMIDDWQNYLRKGNSNVVSGQCVDWYLLGRSYNPSGPEEHFLRQQLAIDKLMKVNPSFGLFWHDLTRAFKSTKGPYSTLEWAVAGGATFTYLRKQNGFFPFEVTWDAPDKVAKDEIFNIDITIKNNAPISMDYYLKLLKVSNLEMFGDISQQFYLALGEIKSFSFQVRAIERTYKKNFMQMIAFMIQYDGLTTQQRYFDFKYIEVR